MLASDFLTTNGVSVKWSNKGVETSRDGWEHTRWTVYVTNQFGRTEHFPYRTGMAHKAPTAEGVIYSLAADCRLFEEHSNPLSVADEFGMSEKEAYRIYDACNEASGILLDLFPAEWEDFLSIDDE